LTKKKKQEMIKRISINKYEFGINARHYWDSQEKEESPWSTEFNSFKLGIEFQRINNYKYNKKGKELNCYIVGINLLVVRIKFFITLRKLKYGN